MCTHTLNKSEIKQLYKDSWSCRDIASKEGVSHMTIYNILRELRIVRSFNEGQKQ